MEMVAHDPSAAKRLGISSKVGKEFVKADVGRKFKAGGLMAKKDARMEPAKMEKGADLKKGNRKFGEHAIQEKGHTRGKNIGDSGKTEGIQSGMKRGGKVSKK
jgi:hypothetical protein